MYATFVEQVWTALATMAYTAVGSLTPHSRHSAVNEIVKRAMVLAKNAAHLAPAGICRAERKRWMVLLSLLYILIWDITCPHTFAPSHQQLAVREVGAVTCQAERQKQVKYAERTAARHFIPMQLRQSNPYLIIIFIVYCTGSSICNHICGRIK